MQPPIKSGSFSVLQDFEKCPFKVYLAKVEKIPEPEIGDDPDHPLVRGDRVHKEAEAFIKGEGPLTHDLRRFEQRLTDLQEKYAEGKVSCEEKWGFTRQWEPTGFYANDVWLRVIADVVEFSDDGKSAIVTDWKTGKSWQKDVPHGMQRQLYAISTFMRYPDVDFIQANMAYLDEGKEKPTNYNRSQLTHFLPKWEQRLSNLTNALTFPPKPNRANCRFCPYGPNDAGNGECAYGVPYDG